MIKIEPEHSRNVPLKAGRLYLRHLEGDGAKDDWDDFVGDVSGSPETGWGIDDCRISEIILWLASTFNVVVETHESNDENTYYQHWKHSYEGDVLVHRIWQDETYECTDPEEAARSSYGVTDLTIVHVCDGIVLDPPEMIHETPEVLDIPDIPDIESGQAEGETHD